MPASEKEGLERDNFDLASAAAQPEVGLACSNKFASGARDAIVVEQPNAIKTYLVRWNGVKIDLTKLARRRWIEKQKK